MELQRKVLNTFLKHQKGEILTLNKWICSSDEFSELHYPSWNGKGWWGNAWIKCLSNITVCHKERWTLIWIHTLNPQFGLFEKLQPAPTCCPDLRKGKYLLWGDRTNDAVCLSRTKRLCRTWKEFLLKGNDDGCKISSPVAQGPLTVGLKPCIANRMFKKDGWFMLRESFWTDKEIWRVVSAFSIDLVRPWPDLKI